jgi:hypothetical protein
LSGRWSGGAPVSGGHELGGAAEEIGAGIARARAIEIVADHGERGESGRARRLAKRMLPSLPLGVTATWLIVTGGRNHGTAAEILRRDPWSTSQASRPAAIPLLDDRGLRAAGPPRRSPALLVTEPLGGVVEIVAWYTTVDNGNGHGRVGNDLAPFARLLLCSARKRHRMNYLISAE